jgi:poly(3-hydroxybutyrate) depolymerase
VLRQRLIVATALLAGHRSLERRGLRRPHGLRVERLRLPGTDHGWPGAGPPLPDRNPSGLDATHELLRFVATAHR